MTKTRAWKIRYSVSGWNIDALPELRNTTVTSTSTRTCAISAISIIGKQSPVIRLRLNGARGPRASGYDRPVRLG
ncbi:hypothetical protein GCM10007856_27500 [Azospirillum oryzae]|nr:hypothetical protein GCM10007856_27500 [Azospirillum oryzae]